MPRPLHILLYMALAAALVACGPEPTADEPDPEPEPPTLDEQLRQTIDAHQLEPIEPPEGLDPARVELGRRLFFDPILSGNKDTSCASCHHPTKMTSDAMPLGAGTVAVVDGQARRPGEDREFIPRNATDLFNRGQEEWRTMFWDSRIRMNGEAMITPAGSRLPDGLDSVLAAQAMFPVVSRDEMRGDRGDVTVTGEPNELAGVVDGLLNTIWDKLMDRLLAIDEYRRMFRAAYPDTPIEELGFEHAARALAAHQIDAYTLPDSPWDRYLAGEDDALSPAQKRGAALFFGEANCGTCHSGKLLTDQNHYNLAIPQFGPGKDPDEPMDLGFGRIRNDRDYNCAFRTPSLRNVELTGPYMHNGAYDSLEEAIRHHLAPEEHLRNYDGEHLSERLRAELHTESFNNDMVMATVAPELDDIPDLSDEQIDELVAFMKALTSPQATELEGGVPEAVPSGLPVE